VGRVSMDYRDRIDSDKGSLERLIGRIPGYRGYKDRELSREADKLLRGEISGKFSQEKDRLLEVQRQLSRGGGLLLLGDIDLAVRRLETLADTVRTATYGYAGLFASINIREEELGALYDHDSALLDQLPVLEAAVGAVQSAVGDATAVREASDKLLEVISDLRRIWDARRDAIMAVS